jgi:hypothetical protein
MPIKDFHLLEYFVSSIRGAHTGHTQRVAFIVGFFDNIEYCAFSSAIYPAFFSGTNRLNLKGCAVKKQDKLRVRCLG